jgi:hypothetical protein
MALRRRLLLFILAFCSLAASATENIERAKRVFHEYVTGYHAFDPAVADLYSDRALVRNRRTYPDGNVRELEFPPQQYKALVRSVMPLAKVRGDRSEYRSPVFVEEAAGVRVQITRHSALKNHTSPMSLLIGPDESGRWLVLEEKTESIP